MFKPTTAKNPDEYLNMIEEPRKAQMEKLHEFIKKAIPQERPHIVSGMIGYGTYHYKSKSGREGEWAPVLLASQKNYISVYVCAVKDGKYLSESYKKLLPKADIGKSCIRFKKTEDIDLPTLKELIVEGAKLLRNG